MNSAVIPTENAIERAEGAFVAAAAGDALGWPQEDRSGIVGGRRNIEPRLAFIGWRRRTGGRYQAHEEQIEAGSYSDDTQLTLAVARSLLHADDWWDVWTRRELPFWLLYERGGGGATLRAASDWASGKPPWAGRDSRRYFDAGGNGVAMRVLPHSVLSAAEPSFHKAAARIMRDGIATHGHPRALVGGLAFGYVLWRALQRSGVLDYGQLIDVTLASADWKVMPTHPAISEWMEQALDNSSRRYVQSWDDAVHEMEDLLDAAREGVGRGSLAVDRSTLDRLGAFDKAVGGAGTVTAASAIFLASRYAAQPTQGLITAAFARGADTDTLASMTGALLGAINGAEWLNGAIRGLEDASYVRELSWRVATGSIEHGQPIPVWPRSTRTRFWREFEHARPGMDVRLPDEREGTVLATVDHESRTQQFEAKTWIVRTVDGQTLHLKLVRRSARADAAATTRTREDAQRPRIGVVLAVSNLERALRFYRDTIGLEVSKEAQWYVTFAGLLALEEAPASGTEVPPGQLSLDDARLEASRVAITVYLVEHDFNAVRVRLRQGGFLTTRFSEREGRRRFRCADPDGNTVEFRERSING